MNGRRQLDGKLCHHRRPYGISRIAFLLVSSTTLVLASCSGSHPASPPPVPTVSPITSSATIAPPSATPNEIGENLPPTDRICHGWIAAWGTLDFSRAARRDSVANALSHG